MTATRDLPSSVRMSHRPTSNTSHHTQGSALPSSTLPQPGLEAVGLDAEDGELTAKDVAQQDSRPLSYIAVARDPVALVVQECITVTGAMRKHARWAHSSVSAILGGATVRPVNLADGNGAKRLSVAGSKPAALASTGDGKDKPRLSGDLGDEEEAQASRWGLRGKKGKSLVDNPLLSAFARLRSELKVCSDIRIFDTPALLHPFLQVIRSSSTSAAITSLALNAVTKFFSYSIISPASPRLPLAMQLLSSAITHCRFEASDSAADEIVLLRILRLMERMVSSPGIGSILSDESVCEIMETGLSMCCQIRLSELLRRNAEIAMVTMCQVVFERLKFLELEAGEDVTALDEDTKNDMDGVKMDPTVNGETVTVPPVKDEIPDGASTPGRTSNVEQTQEPEATAKDRPQVVVRRSSSQLDIAPSAKAISKATDHDIKPFSLPSIRELFRVLVDLLDPSDKQRNDTMRIMALRIVDVALEVAGPSIANHPSLALLAKDTLCRHLFRLVRSESMAVLNESLRVAGTLLATCRGVLKLQQELFLSYVVACLFPRVDIPQEQGIDPRLYEGVPQAPGLVKPAPSQSSSGRSTPVPIKDRQKLGLEGGSRKPDAREAMVESLGALVKIPSFMAELFVNYDCEIDRSDVCVDMVGLLSRNAFPDSATWSTTNVPPLCLDALLGYVQSIADRLDDPVDHDDLETMRRLRSQRNLKKIIAKGATKFNEDPRAGIAYLAGQGIIDEVADPKPASIAKFLRGTTRIDKKVLGDYLSKKNNGDILTAYMDSFNFSGKRVDEALRQLLYSFRLPGESQLIERIVTEFSEQYVSKETPESIATKDACFVLTYAIIMLNVDQHSPKVKGQERMTVQDFSKNLRGVNDGKDFPPDYLADIYNAVHTEEFILPEEHDNQQSYDHAWKELLVKVESASDMRPCTSNAFDADMFAATWRPIVATLTYVFISASDDTVFSRVVTGFDQCAKIAAKYQLSEAIDQIIFCLSHISTLATELPTNTNLNTEVQIKDKRVMVSETAVRFGRDYKAQLATFVLFRVVTGHEPVIQKGWQHLVSIILNLFVNSLIPPTFESIPKKLEMPPIPLQPPTQVIEREARGNDVGLFSAFTSYVSSFTNDEPPEPSEQEIEYTLCTVDCINACSLDDIFANIAALPVETLKHFLYYLLAQIPEDNSPRVIVVKSEIPNQANSRQTNGHKSTSVKLIYDPRLVFTLELATLLTIRDGETIDALAKEVAEPLQTLIQNAENIHSSVVNRSIYYLLSILRISASTQDIIRVPVMLHTISSFPQALLETSSLPLLRGLSDCVTGPANLRSEVGSSPDFWQILGRLGRYPEASAAVFKIVEDLIAVDDQKKTGINADNYEQCVMLLNDFATAAQVGASKERGRESNARDGKRSGKAEATGDTADAKIHTEKLDGVVRRGVRSVGLAYSLVDRVQLWIRASHLERGEAWTAYWSPLFQILTTQSLNPCRAIRSASLTSLQRCLLSPALTAVPLDLQQEGLEYILVLRDVLFPLISQLLKPEVYQTDSAGMSDTRIQAASLLGRLFLHALQSGGLEFTQDATISIPTSPVNLTGPKEGPASLQSPATDATDDDSRTLISVWIKLLSTFERLVTSSGPVSSDHLEEAIVESLKNILLVMSSEGYLVPPAKNGDGRQFWNETWRRLDRFVPNLLSELFPSEVEQGRGKPWIEKKSSQLQDARAISTEAAATSTEDVASVNPPASGEVQEDRNEDDVD